MRGSAAVTLLVLGSLGACAGLQTDSGDQSGSGTLPVADKVGDGEVRTAPDSLSSRWPLLGTDIESAHWMSGQLGADRVPGPASYWIDAVIVVSDASMDRLTTDFDLVPVGSPTGIEPELEAFLPAGTPVGSPALDAATGNDFNGTVFVYRDASTVVILARFG